MRQLVFFIVQNGYSAIHCIHKDIIQISVLIQASDLRDAVKKLDEGMKGSMADYEIASMAETPIMDVYRYEVEPDVKPEFPEA